MGPYVVYIALLFHQGLLVVWLWNVKESLSHMTVHVYVEVTTRGKLAHLLSYSAGTQICHDSCILFK